MYFSPSALVRKTIDSLYQEAKQRFRQWTKPDNQALALNAAMDLTRSRQELLLENLLLRQQFIVLNRQVRRPALTWHDRSLFVLLASRLPARKAALVIA